MLGNFVGYLFGNNYSGTQDSLEEDPRTRGIMRRFRQVEVEDDEWILIDRTVEGTLEEPWYEMPPAVFTQEGPIKVATSPMENLLIEHPSMSVYSVVSGTSPPVTPDTPPPSPDRWIEGQKDVDVGQTIDVPQNVPPAPPADLSSSTSSALCTVSTSLDSSLDRSNIDELSRRVVAELQAIHNDRLPASDSNNNNKARIGKQLRTAQERAQEMLQKRSTQSLKRARMERSNKVRQAKGKRLRRQDRLRVCHSGANNNRKC
ncbi:hypothetical protein EAG_11563 [Camponotus floridanus]|uniref:Tumor protein p53-inducible nuclear protein 2 n=1 Tax=Camponotus floridanus TaxID=104421 RepID=E2AAQ6_CAMFO|nr:uncharacterized protein LOC105250285 [Camponotus floridanus]EFN69506.1 hypothetical protein EAG_11563 [Camponotus floridanus]